MTGDNQGITRYKKITVILSLICTGFLFSTIFLWLSADSPSTHVAPVNVNYDNINEIALNFKKYAIGPEGIDRLSQNIMLLTKLATEIELSDDYSSEFMLYHSSMILLHTMQTRDGQAFVKENSDTLATLYANIYEARRTKDQEQYSLEVRRIYKFLTRGHPEGR